MTRKSLEIEGDGKMHAIAFTTNAMARYQEHLGESIIVTGFEASRGRRLRCQSGSGRSFWCVLPGKHSGTRPGDIMDAIGLDVVREKIGEAVQPRLPAEATPKRESNRRSGRGLARAHGWRRGRIMSTFWRLTPAEIAVRARCLSVQRRLREHDEARMRNHELAAWVGIAINNPKKFPKFAPTGQAGKKKEASTQVDDERVRAFFIGKALRGA